MPLVSRSAIIIGLAAILVTGKVTAAEWMAPSWSGPYFGVNAGYALSRAQFDSGDLAASGIPGSVSGPAANGIAFGFNTGANWQAGLLVYGIEGDWSRFRLRSDQAVSVSFPPFGTVAGGLGSEIDWAATLRARTGLAFGDVLLYATGGGALGRASGDLVLSGLGTPVYFSGSSLMAGWVVGGGIEALFLQHWSARAELLRVHMGSDPFSFKSSTAPVTGSVDVTTFRAGINYKF